MSALRARLFSLYLAVQAPLRENGWIARSRSLRKASRWLYGRLKCGETVDVPARGATWRMDVRDGFFTQGMVVEGDNEGWETGFFLDLVREGMTVVDVGAHIGWYTVLSSRRVGPSGKVVAFEPDPVNFGLLRQNLALNRCANVEAVQKGVADRSSQASLIFASGNCGNHRIALDGPPGGAGGGPVVDVTSLDEFFNDLGRQVDVVKMDIEGAELLAWRGMQGFLQRHQGIKIMMEFYPSLLSFYGSSHAELFREYGRQGFIPHRIDERLGRLVVTDLEDLERICVEGRGYTNVFLSREPMDATMAGNR